MIIIDVGEVLTKKKRTPVPVHPRSNCDHVLTTCLPQCIANNAKLAADH